MSATKYPNLWHFVRKWTMTLTLTLTLKDLSHHDQLRMNPQNLHSMMTEDWKGGVKISESHESKDASCKYSVSNN